MHIWRCRPIQLNRREKKTMPNKTETTLHCRPLAVVAVSYLCKFYYTETGFALTQNVHRVFGVSCVVNAIKFVVSSLLSDLRTCDKRTRMHLWIYSDTWTPVVWLDWLIELIEWMSANFRNVACGALSVLRFLFQDWRQWSARAFIRVINAWNVDVQIFAAVNRHDDRI